MNKLILALGVVALLAGNQAIACENMKVVEGVKNAMKSADTYHAMQLGKAKHVASNEEVHQCGCMGQQYGDSYAEHHQASGQGKNPEK